MNTGSIDKGTAQHRFTITAAEAGSRLDAVLAARGVAGLSRSRLKTLMAAGVLSRAGVAVTDASTKAKEAEEYVLSIPEATPVAIAAVAIPFGVVYEDAHLLVIDKPAGLTVHPAAGNTDHTLVNALLAYCGDTLSGIGGELRPGIVHRLDKDTSGLMVVAKHDAAHQALSAQLADRSLSRVYQALVWGCPTPMQGVVDAAIGRSPRDRKKMAVVSTGGKSAITHYKVEQRFHSQPTAKKPSAPVVSLITCKLQTGRTHQIRVHMAHLGHALVGDPQYAGRSTPRLAHYSEEQVPPKAREALVAFPRQALHAAEIGFIHPISGEAMRFSCNLSDDMRELITICESELLS